MHIVLHEPEIPNNTGNIGRTCVAAGCALHLIRPLGFSTSVKALRRAGLDYWPRLAPVEHESFDHYLGTAHPERLWLFTTKSARPMFDATIDPGDHLVFGKETRGLPDEFLARFPDRLVSLPMLPGERSLNLATAVCAAVYVGVGDMRRRGLARLSPDGRLASWTRAQRPGGA
ncbi:MAG: tRNA (cytidine(34)-2'-O)-methyltransferase [Phycisphaerae bacterium]|nr:tRNA (cytidine(34)-2'-O)-methyltransferase [Phycisphaerae bacterium]